MIEGDVSWNDRSRPLVRIQMNPSCQSRYRQEKPVRSDDTDVGGKFVRVCPGKISRDHKHTVVDTLVSPVSRGRNVKTSLETVAWACSQKRNQ